MMLTLLFHIGETTHLKLCCNKLLNSLINTEFLQFQTVSELHIVVLNHVKVS